VPAKGLIAPLAVARLWRAAHYAVLVLLALVFVGPFLWMLSMAVRGSGNIYALQLIPDSPTLDNFRFVWHSGNLKSAFFNSAGVAFAVVTLNVLLASLAAYPLARLEFKGSRIIFLLILSTLMIPFQLYMIPLYLLCLKLRLDDTLTGVALPWAVGAVSIYLLKQYYATIPKELDEAARIDGAGELGVWWWIMFPLTRPAVAAMAIFVFVQNWSNFLWPLILLNDEKKYTLPIAVAKLSGAFVDKSQYIAAGSVLAVAPVIVLFFALQRHFIGGLTVGGVKG